MLLDPTEFRTFGDTSLGDEALQTLLDAAEETIDKTIGPLGTVTEWITPGSGERIMLTRRASSVSSLVEDTVTLASNDYELSPSGLTLRRLDTGTNPQTRWRGRVTVAYLPADDESRRKVAQAALVRLDIDAQEGGTTTQERIGDWTETRSTAEETQAKRAEILSALSERFVLL